MKNQEIDTKLAIIIIVIFAITAGMFVRLVEKNREVEGQSQQVVDVKKPAISQLPTVNQQGQMQVQQKENPILPEEVGKVSESISINDWKLYTNKKDGYSIKYPSTWIADFIDGTSFYNKELVSRDSGMNNLSGDYFINISIYKGMGTHANLKEWRKYDGNNYQEVLINGNEALKFSADSLMPNVRRYYFIRNNNDGYEITVRYAGNIDNTGDRIISTLKFIN
jgi:hypothetical protein